MTDGDIAVACYDLSGIVNLGESFHANAARSLSRDLRLNCSGLQVIPLLKTAVRVGAESDIEITGGAVRGIIVKGMKAGE